MGESNSAITLAIVTQ